MNTRRPSLSLLAAGLLLAGGSASARAWPQADALRAEAVHAAEHPLRHGAEDVDHGDVDHDGLDHRDVDHDDLDHGTDGHHGHDALGAVDAAEERRAQVHLAGGLPAGAVDGGLAPARPSAAAAAPKGNGALMAASFARFRPKVRFYWDDSWFYVESDGMPDRTLMPDLMVGIRSWQQQIPLPVSYFLGTTNPERNAAGQGYGQPNVWRLPLVPTPAQNPIPLSDGNFLRGAVAIGVDGIPIFNPRNNRGEFSQDIGELDHYGGHVGLADDFHYHIGPVHLRSRLGDALPVAWALDGYPIYGYDEPDGSPRLPLDAEGGHEHGRWPYHYHTLGSLATGPQRPYLMNAFHGQVASFGGQVDPQPGVSPIRASGTGGYTAKQVPGAEIIAFKNPVALSTDASGHLVEAPGGRASDDQFLMRYRAGGKDYDIAWRLDRISDPKAVTVTWRLPTIDSTTTTYANKLNRITSYPLAGPSLAALPDTGQTLDATTVFGEDSDYSIHPPAYLDNGDGTVTDLVTGLMWQKVDMGEMTWEQAMARPAGIDTGGHRDWRLPTALEAFSILDHDRKPALNPSYFGSAPGSTAEYWWTLDNYAGDARRAWVTNAGGGLGPHLKSETLSAGGSRRIHARYVRGAPPSDGHNYRNNDDGTVTDLDTGLMWTRAPSADALAWTAALGYAEGLELAGHDDWRLPNVKELQSLVDLNLATGSGSASQPSLNRLLFPQVPAKAFWSSTSLRGRSNDQAWLVDFGVDTAVAAAVGPARGQQGIVSYEAHTAAHPVLAVRSAADACAARAVTQGRASKLLDNLLPTTVKGSRVSAVGSIQSADGRAWTVPAATLFQTAAKAADLYNEVTGVTPPNIGAVNLEAVPIVEVDPGGELVTGYLFADNYFELYVNGKLVAVDPVPYTPFNSAVVRFRARRPISYAVRLVDWEENLGLGMELNGGNAYHPGDGGFMASFSDGTVTDGRWQAQSFYIAPLDDPALVVERADGGHDSSAASLSPTRREDAYALHYPLPEDWSDPAYDACPWPAASTYSEAAVGVDNKPAYTNFPAQFSRSGAQFIWSSNLVLDNEVIVRYTGPGPTPSPGPSSTAGPSATATANAPATATRRPRPTRTAEASPAPSASPTPTARPGCLLLPWLVAPVRQAHPPTHEGAAGARRLFITGYPDMAR